MFIYIFQIENLKNTETREALITFAKQNHNSAKLEEIK